jgi:FAD/FMN-containing dehydrogenase
MSRTDADIAAMRAVKAAFDPGGYLNPAVLFG